MAIRILTDSASDISPEKAQEWNITVIPLKVRFGDTEYLDGVTLRPKQFFEKLIETDELPKTSQITPYEYEQEFEKARSAGDQLICLTISSGVSGCYQSACFAAQEYEDCVTVIDTQQFCISQYIIVERAVQLRDQGLSYEEIVRTIREELKESHVIAVFDTLEYLRLGGRLSAAAALTGTLLSIKPVLTIEDGIVKILGKARGSRHSENMLTENIAKLGKIDYDRPVCLGYTGTNDDFLQKYVRDSKALYEGYEDHLQVAEVGATIGTYSGPGAIAVAFFAKAGK